MSSRPFTIETVWAANNLTHAKPPGDSAAGAQRRASWCRSRRTPADGSAQRSPIDVTRQWSRGGGRANVRHEKGRSFRPGLFMRSE